MAGGRGEANCSAKLTCAQVSQIRAIPCDVPQWMMGALYGVSQTTVGRIRRRITWAHLA